jgi:hypothetical protein
MADRGRLAFNSPEELEEAILDYFSGLQIWHDEHVVRGEGENREEFTRKVLIKDAPPTVAGLARHLGVVHRTLRNYKHRDEFAAVIARALNAIAEYAETRLYDKSGSNGARFALEVNHGYGIEDEHGADGEAFQMNVIAPGGEAALAIPKFEEED